MSLNAIPVEIIQISTSFTNRNGFVILMKELGGNRKVQIIVAMPDAQAIAISLEKIHTTRPVSHQFFSEIMLHFDIHLKNVLIHTFDDGIFYANSNFEGPEGETISIDCRPSDAICLALRQNKPILVADHLLEQMSNKVSEKNHKPPQSLEEMPTSQLKALLSDAIEKENFELAEKIKRILDKR